MIGGDQLWRLFFDRGGRTLRLSVRSAAADSGIGAISHEALWRSKSVLRRLPPEVPRRRSGPLSGHGVLRPNDRHGRSAADDRRVWTSAIWNGRPALGRLGSVGTRNSNCDTTRKRGPRFRSGVAGQRPGFVSLTIEDQFLRRLPYHPPCHLSGTCPTMTPAARDAIGHPMTLCLFRIRCAFRRPGAPGSGARPAPAGAAPRITPAA